jgi:hypothetical protein
MPAPRDPDRETFTRIMVALAVNDAIDPPTTSEIEQMADELLEWGHRLKDEFRRAEIADRIAKLSRDEVEAQLATRLLPTACCTQWGGAANDSDPATLSDDDLRERLIEAEAFVDRVAA